MRVPHGNLRHLPRCVLSVLPVLPSSGALEAGRGGPDKKTQNCLMLGHSAKRPEDDVLVGLLDRVEQYNSDPDKILTVKAVAVFGSFLGQTQKLGDLDVAVKYEDRNLDRDRAKTALAYASKSGRQFCTFVDQLAWPETELRQVLKARKRTIRLQAWDSFVRIVADDPVRVPYKIVFGCPEEVDAEIVKVRASKQAG